MNMPPEFDQEEGDRMRGLVLAIVGSLAFYTIMALCICLHLR